MNQTLTQGLNEKTGYFNFLILFLFVGTFLLMLVRLIKVTLGV
jgi:hypothetical protein